MNEFSLFNWWNSCNNLFCVNWLIKKIFYYKNEMTIIYDNLKTVFTYFYIFIIILIFIILVK